MVVSLRPSETDRDALTIELLRGDDPDALRRLLRDHGGRVRNELRTIFKGQLDETEIDEVLSLAIQVAWRQRHSYDPSRGSLGVWLFVNARARALRLLEQKRRQFALVSFDELAPTAPCKMERLDTSHHDGRFLKDLYASIRHLQARERAVILADLAAGDVANADQLATELGTSKNAVYVARATARRKLRGSLSHLGYFLDLLPDEPANEALESA